MLEILEPSVRDSKKDGMGWDGIEGRKERRREGGKDGRKEGGKEYCKLYVSWKL